MAVKTQQQLQDQIINVSKITSEIGSNRSKGLNPEIILNRSLGHYNELLRDIIDSVQNIVDSGDSLLDIGDEIGSGTAGSVLFIDASGNLGEDNTNLTWDDAANKFKVGADLYLTADGRIGIGVDPVVPFHVAGPGTDDTTYSAIFENGSGDDVFSVRDDESIILHNSSGASSILLDEAASGIQLSIGDFNGVGNTITFQLGSTGGSVSRINTTGAAWTMNKNLRFDTSGQSGIYVNNGGNGLTINGQNNTTGEFGITIADDGEVGIGQTSDPVAILQVVPSSTAGTQNAWGTDGIYSRFETATFTDADTAASGTVATAVFHSFSIPTFASSNGGSGTEVTATDATTIYVEGPPAATVDNTIITNALSLWVDDGTTRLDGDLDHRGTNLGLFGTTPTSQPSDLGALTDNLSGSTDGDMQALSDPGDAPVDADALRDDLVANLIPELRNNLAELTEKYNNLRTQVLQALGLTA